MLYDFTAFANFADKAESDPRLCELADRYDSDPHSLSDDELTELVNRYDMAGEDDEDYYPDVDDYYEDWDNLEMGFDPYMGCYSDDC